MRFDVSDGPLVTAPEHLDPVEGSMSGWVLSDGGPTTVVGIHDLSANGLWFGDLAESCGATCAMIAPDLAGRAAAHRSATVDPSASRADQLWHFIDGLCPGPVILVGHGTGAALALDAASARPDRTSAVILADGPPLVPASAPTNDWFDCAKRIDPGAARLRMVFVQRSAALDAGVRSGRLPATGMSRNLRRAVDAEITGSGFTWRARLDEKELRHDIEALTSQPSIRSPDVPVCALQAAHGHRSEDPPLVLTAQPDNVRTLNCTHSGLLWDRNALAAIADTIASARDA